MVPYEDLVRSLDCSADPRWCCHRKGVITLGALSRVGIPLGGYDPTHLKESIVMRDASKGGKSGEGEDGFR